LCARDFDIWLRREDFGFGVMEKCRRDASSTKNVRFAVELGARFLDFRLGRVIILRMEVG